MRKLKFRKESDSGSNIDSDVLAMLKQLERDDDITILSHVDNEIILTNGHFLHRVTMFGNYCEVCDLDPSNCRKYNDVDDVIDHVLS
jgi:hypothetical protein